MRKGALPLSRRFVEVQVLYDAAVNAAIIELGALPAGKVLEYSVEVPDPSGAPVGILLHFDADDILREVELLDARHQIPQMLPLTEATDTPSIDT